MLCASLPATQSAETYTAPSEGEAWAIAKLIRDLDDDSYDVRELASSRLQQEEKAFDALERVVRDSSSAEVRSRAQALLHQIKPLRFLKNGKGGDADNGIQVLLALEADVLTEDMPVYIHVGLKNVSNNERKVVSIRGVDLNSEKYNLGYTTHQASMTLKQLTGREPRGAAGARMSGEDVDRTAIRLVPGAIQCATFQLTRWKYWTHGTYSPDWNVELSPGEWEITLTYHSNTRDLLPDAKKDLVSNVVRFKIVEKEKDSSARSAKPAD